MFSPPPLPRTPLPPLPKKRLVCEHDFGLMGCDCRDHGVKQFVSRYRKVEGIENDELKWGDEVSVKGQRDDIALVVLVCICMLPP